MTTLTNSALDAMPDGAELKDDRVPGLSARKHKSGTSFLLYYRTSAGTPRRPKIGNYPLLTLSQAREIAKAMLAKVSAGGDPVAERNIGRLEPTIDALGDRCAREHYTHTEWHNEAIRLYRRNASPSIGKMRVRAAGYVDVHAIHAKLKDRPVEANRTIAVLSKMFSLAERWGWRDAGSNPCQHVERYREVKRRRFATADEIAKVGQILDRYAADLEHATGVAFLYLLMFSGARPSEIERATPDMVERRGEMGVLRIANGKTGRRDVFLPPQAMAVLAKLPPNRSRLAGRKTLPRRLWELVREEAGCPDLWARDWRRTFGTMALSSGAATLDQLGELLGHASRQTTMIYAKLIEDAAHDATARVAGKMEQLLGGKHVASNGSAGAADDAGAG